MGVRDEETTKPAMSQYQKQQEISAHSNGVTYISMTAMITICPAFVLFLYVTLLFFSLSLSLWYPASQFRSLFVCLHALLCSIGAFRVVD